MTDDEKRLAMKAVWKMARSSMPPYELPASCFLEEMIEEIVRPYMEKMGEELVRSTLVKKMIVGFVEKSGGLVKCQKLLEAMRKVPDEKRADFVRGCGKTDAGARQLMAFALLGLSIAVEATRAG
jgi:hypothetical protein